MSSRTTSIGLALLALPLVTTASMTQADAAAGHKLDAIHITGSKSVPEAQIRAAIKEQVGDTVTTDEIVADQGTISTMLGKANVGGSIKTSMTTRPNGHIEVTFAITDEGVVAPTVTTVAPKLEKQVFAGNVKESSADLEVATGLKRGDDLTNEKLKTAQAAIVEVYKKAKKVNVSVGFDPKSIGGGKTELDWTIAETPPKEDKAAKRKKREDEPGMVVDP